MKYLAWIPGLLSLLMIAACFAVKAKRRAREGRGLVSLPFAVAGAGMLALLFCIPATILLWQGKLLGLAFLAFTAVGWVLMLAYCNCWIEYDRQGFTHSNLPGVRRRFAYTDVAPIPRAGYQQALAGHDFRFRAGKRSVLIDTMSRNREDFLLTLSKHLQKTQWSKDAPRGWDPYGHNVPQPDRWFLFVVIHLLLLALLVLFAWIVIDLRAPAETAETADHLVLSFSEYREHKGDWDLTASNGETYYLDMDSEKAGVSPDALCDGKMQYDVWVYRGKRSICAIRAVTGEEILTFAQTRELRVRDSRIAMPIFLLFLAGMIWVDIGMIRTARHPERYSIRYRRLFWQDRYLLSDTVLPARFARSGKKNRKGR